MLAMPGMRAFSLATKRQAGRVSCSEAGVCVGHIPLLACLHDSWAVRPIAELNDELTGCYRLPIDIASKANALALIANALNRGDWAMAAIAAVQMQIPDPPSLAKGSENPDNIVCRARELACSGLLKADWDPAQHPRAGVPPNPGWFAAAGGDGESVSVVPVSMHDLPEDKKLDLLDGSGGGGESLPEPDGSEPELRHEPLRLPPPGGLPKSPSIGPQPALPFPSGLPPQLAPFTGGKTSGIFQTPNSPPVELQSGYEGPTADMPPGSPGFDLITKSHVEGQAAALMRQQAISEATLYINNPKICGSCTRWLPRMLPPGATLNIVLPDKTVMSFKGIGP